MKTLISMTRHLGGTSVTLHSNSVTNNFSGFSFTFHYNKIRGERTDMFDTEFVAIRVLIPYHNRNLTSQVTVTL